jgi:hypothetical protein
VKQSEVWIGHAICASRCFGRDHNKFCLPRFAILRSESKHPSRVEIFTQLLWRVGLLSLATETTIGRVNVFLQHWDMPSLIGNMLCASMELIQLEVGPREFFRFASSQDIIGWDNFLLGMVSMHLRPIQLRGPVHKLLGPNHESKKSCHSEWYPRYPKF